MAESSQRRIFVGGLFPEVTDADLKERFQRFGAVTSVEVKRKTSLQGATAKTFAYLDLDVTDTNYKKCLSTYNNTKWRGGIVSIQPAKQSFLTRLREERRSNQDAQQASAEKESQGDDVVILPRVEERYEHFKKAGVKDYHVDKAVPGTTIEGEKNWIVGKYGRVMPIVYIRRRDKKKIMKVDPSKYVHHLKVMKDADIKKSDSVHKSVTKLTWNVPEQKSSNYRKRKGDFPPNTKRNKSEVRTSKMLRTQPKDKNSFSISIQDRFDVPKSSKESSRSTNGTAYNDFEVAGENVENQSVSHTDYSFHLNKKRYGQGDKSCGNQERTPSDAADSDLDSCGSADTDEICFARKPVITDRRSEMDGMYSSQIRSNDSVPKLITKGEQSTSKTGIDSRMSSSKLRTASNIKTNMEASSDESSLDENDKSSSSLENDEGSNQVNQKVQPSYHISQTIPSKTTDVMSLEQSGDDSSSESSIGETDDDDESKSGEKLDETLKTRNLQTKSVLQKTLAPKIARNDLASFMGETSSDESSVELTAIKAENKTQKKTIPGHVSHPKANPMQTLAPKITSKDLASFMGETSSEESDEEDTTNKMTSRQTFHPPVIVKQTYAPRISGENFKSFMQDTSSDDDSGSESSNESSESSSESEDENEEGKSSNSEIKHRIRVSKRQAIDADDVRQNCAVINAILSDNSKIISKNSKGDTNSATKLSIDKTKEETQSRTASKIESDLRTKNMGQKEDKSVNMKSDTSDTSKASGKKMDRSKVIEDPKKKALGNEARLESLKRKHSVMTKQQAMIQDALAGVDAKDAKTPGKHFRFDSDSEEDEEEMEQNYLIQKKGAASKSSMQLFDSDDEADDPQDADDGIKFDKPQYEGKHGAKLMKMQSRFGGDSRFKMDEKFLDKDVESDSEQSGTDEDLDPEEEDLKEERKKSLAILEKIVGTQAMAKQKKLAEGRNTFKDLNALHYDPSKVEHSKFERKPDEGDQEESDEDGEAPKIQREELPPPEVSKDKFFEVSTSLKDVFSTNTNQDDGGDKTPFTFFSQADSEDEEEKAEEDKPSDADAPPLSTIDLMWTPKKFAYDSSDSEKEDEVPAKSTNTRITDDSKKTDAKNDSQPPPRKFFFQPDDIRLKEGPLWFFNIPKAAHHQDEMDERKEELKAGFRKRHKRAVRTWNRKKMERHERKQKR